MSFLLGRTAALGLVLLLCGCGVKNDLTKPNGQPTARGQVDPSKPPVER